MKISKETCTQKPKDEQVVLRYSYTKTRFVFGWRGEVIHQHVCVGGGGEAINPHYMIWDLGW